jgi:hypothetical protein
MHADRGHDGSGAGDLNVQKWSAVQYFLQLKSELVDPTSFCPQNLLRKTNSAMPV